MRFGIMTQLQTPRPWPDQRDWSAYQNALEQGESAEKHGFEYFWITEQHFFSEIGHCACSEMFLAALSQRTTKLRMGLGVVVLPLHHPFNVAERVATLDVLSSGRVEFGSGRGTTPYIVEGFGLDPQKSRAAGNESLQAVLRMFEEDPFTGFAGEHFELPARHVIPKPVQLPHPPLWVAATNLETYEHAARQGVGVIGVTRNSHSETRKAIETYRSISRSQTAPTVSRCRNENVAVFGITCCDSDDAVGKGTACAAARWYYGDNDAELNHLRFATAGGVDKIKQRISAMSDDDLIDAGMALGGNPETLCRQVEGWAATGIDQMIFMIQAGKATHAQVMRSIELIGHEVIPRFQ